jgi:3-oxoacyl-[acyl-carrier-protein] synthase-3
MSATASRIGLEVGQRAATLPVPGLIRAVLTGTGRSLPVRTLRNDDFPASLETSDEWIFSRTGIRERHIAGPEDNSFSLGLEASEQALRRCGLTGRDLDLIIVATVTPLTMVPSNACRLQGALGCRAIAAFDVNAACTGFVQALDLARQFIATGSCKHVLVVGAEVLSRVVDYTDRTTCILFGDGAGAVVLSAAPGEQERGLRWVRMFSDGMRGELINLASPVTYRGMPMTPDSAGAGRGFLRLNGREVFKFAVRALVGLVQEALTLLPPTDRLFLVPHQVNQRIIDAALQELPLSPAQVVVNLEHCGNTSAASIPIALDEALRGQALGAGDHVILAAFGGGLTWGGALLSL